MFTASTVMIRVRRDLRDRLHAIASLDHASMQDVLDPALDMYERRRLLEETNRAYANLRADARTWAAFEAEQHGFDGALVDGIAVSDEFATW